MYNDGSPQVNHQGITLLAKGYLDTVSIIRGSYGREALKEEQRIYFMNLKQELGGPGVLQCKTWYKFEFVLKANVGSEELVESYIGVDFSILYEAHISIKVGPRTYTTKEDFYSAING